MFEKDIYFKGDISTGILIDVKCQTDISGLKIVNNSTKEIFKLKDIWLLDTGEETSILKGDEIIISTVKGNKKVEVIRGNQKYNALSLIDLSSDWLSLVYGDNIISYQTANNGKIELSISNEILYEGI